MEKTFEGFIKLNGSKLFENNKFSSTKGWFIDAIDNIKGFVRSNNTRTKYKDYLKAIENFSEENQTISKKELTKIKNDLSDLCTSYYSILDNIVEVKDEYVDRMNKTTESKEALKGLLNKRGYNSYYDIERKEGKSELYNLYRFLMLIRVFSIEDPKRILINMDSFKSVMNNDEIDWFDKYYPNLDKWVELNSELKNIETILNPTKEQKQKNQLKLMTVKGAVNPKLKDAVDKIADDFRVVIENNEYNHYIKTVSIYNEKYPNGIPPEIYFKSYSKNEFIKVAYKNNFNQNYILLPNYDELLKAEALKVSKTQILPFQIKMYDKLSGFMKELDKEFDVSVYGRSKNRNNISFNFKDGSRFSIQNSIVSKFSHLGTFFYTYPTTFHNAYLPNGEKISNPNEYTVKTAFNKYNNESH